ncbi:hypothetical protein CLU79DRAFT_693988 [Phycomyces nitens]|nr:hypothetical protein CLU79DRAFT_693988 [Phycomyces nitens]
MRESLFKMFGSFQIVQEVSGSTTQPSTTTNRSDPTPLEEANPCPTTNHTEPSSLPSRISTFPLSISVPTRTRSFVLTIPSSPITMSVPSPVRTHARKNSKYRVRHHRPRQLTNSSTSPDMNGKKSKSQKLLCLWPLPIITRYIIVISVLLSALNFFDLIHLKCSAPSYVIHRLEIVNLFLSPFLFEFSLPTVLLFGWNVLILGLFEESLAHMLGSTRRFIKVLLGVVLTVCTARQFIGYLFTKSTGWAVPLLFFSDSAHECSQGLAPFLFALLVVQSLNIEDKYILIYGDEDSHNKLTVHKVILQFLMCLVNYTVKNILWWSLTGLLTGYMTTVLIQSWLAREKWDYGQEVKDVSEFIAQERYRRTPLWRLLWLAMKKGAFVVGVTLSVLLICNSYHTREYLVEPATMNGMSNDRYLFTFVFMTAPRRSNPPYLTRTLESYLANWPVNPAPNSLYSRIQTVVYTHFTNHSQFDAARERFANDLKGQQYIRWIREEGDQLNQRLHVSKALDLVTDNMQTTYIALMEDDFPVCGAHEWREIENVIYKANQQVPNHCGIFVGTGGR